MTSSDYVAAIEQLPSIFPAIQMQLWNVSNRFTAPSMLLILNSIRFSYDRINQGDPTRTAIGEGVYKTDFLIVAKSMDDIIKIYTYFCGGIRQIHYSYPIQFDPLTLSDNNEGTLKGLFVGSGSFSMTMPEYEMDSPDLTPVFGRTINLTDVVLNTAPVNHITIDPPT